VNLEGFAAALRGLADRAESELALQCIRPAARECLASLQMETPVKSGALRGSEVIRSVSGSGAFAEAIYGPDIIYDKFRDQGGTIDAKPGLGRKGMRPHTLHWPGGGFPLHVTQHGAHYMEKGEELARSNVGTIIQTELSDFLTL
jgi:hypothetical protein